MEKEIIVLTKSSKHGEFCIAGIDTETGAWIRPVSNNSSNEGSVPKVDITYEDGTELQILDIVKIQLLSHSPSFSQPENYAYDPEFYWEKTGESTMNEVINFRGYDDVDVIFYNCEKDVEESEINGGPSLLLLRVENPCIVIKTFERKKIQLNFEYNGIHYRYFSISDPEVKKHYDFKDDGKYRIGKDLDLVLSLTDIYSESSKYYKMAAQIFGWKVEVFNMFQ